MTEGTITFDENSFPVELVTARDIERAISAGRLRPDSLVTEHRVGQAPITARAAEVARLKPFLGILPEEPMPNTAVSERGKQAPEHPASSGAEYVQLWESATGSSRVTSSASEGRATSFGNKLQPVDTGYKEPTEFISCAFSPLKRYAQIDGRSSRREFWGFALVGVAIVFVALVMAGTGSENSGAGLFVLAALCLFIPSWAVAVRRLHDHGKSGWWVLLNFIPYVGWLVVVLLMCLPGDTDDNRYGPNPKQF